MSFLGRHRHLNFNALHSPLPHPPIRAAPRSRVHTATVVHCDEQHFLQKLSNATELSKQTSTYSMYIPWVAMYFCGLE